MRYYDPTAGRFLTKDPIGFAGGDVNLYRYVFNNPINWIDSFGLAPGDVFETKDEAAIDAIDFIMNTSNREGREYGGFIYRNKKGFSYTEAMPGTPRNIDVKTFNCPPEGTQKEGIYHTHIGTDYGATRWSTDDSFIAIFHGGDIYLGTISGLIKVWNSWTGERIVRKPF